MANEIDDVLNQIEVCKKWRERLNEKLAEAISRENERLKTGGKAVSYIDEATHIQLIHAVGDLIKVADSLMDMAPGSMTLDSAWKIRKAQELRQVALVQLKRAGVTVEQAEK